MKEAIKRPISLTIISWIIIISGIYTIFYGFYLIHSVERISNMGWGILSADLLVSFLSVLGAILMLKGNKKGRFLSTLIIIVSFIYILSMLNRDTPTSLVHVFINAMRGIVIIFYLYRPKANEYFNAINSNELQKS